VILGIKKAGYENRLKTGGLGFEPDTNVPKTPEKQHVLTSVPPPVPPNSLPDSDLLVIVENWISLEPPIKLAIMALVRTSLEREVK
jgi:hypothetical protein